MIEFVKGEGFCRWNGTIMSPENCVKMFGTDGEIYIEDNFIDDGSTIYTDEPIGKILSMLGEKHEKPAPYDEVVDQGYGWKGHCWEEKLAGKIVFDIDFIENLVVKPMKMFKKDYPNFDEEKHNAFYDELDKYYDEYFTQCNRPGATEEN